jgi:uncharacterized iron-regulated membrane protein
VTLGTSPRLRDLRIAIRRIHLWLGVSLGLVFAVLGLTGSALVFYVEIDGWLNPVGQADSAEPSAGIATPVYDQALATGHANFPVAGDWSIELTGAGGPIPARYYPAEGGHGHHAQREMVWFSADGTRIVRSDTWGEYLMSWLYELHMNLLAGNLGMQIVGWSGFATLALLLTGLAAWWPRRSWRKAIAFKRRAIAMRRLRDLHKLAGLASIILLILLSLTGALLALPAVKESIFAATIVPIDPVPEPATATGSMPEISLAQALSQARTAIPHGRPTFVDIPGDPAVPLRVRIQGQGDLHGRFPGSFVFLDRRTGAVVATLDTARGNSATRLNTWIRPIHDGSIGGLGTRFLAILAGLMPSLLFITGLLHWLRRRSARRAGRTSDS